MMSKLTKASSLTAFLKENKKNLRETTTYKVSRTFLDEEGNVLDWVIRPLTTEQTELIRERCTREVPVKGKGNLYRSTVDTRGYMAELMAASVAEPNLNAAELQDSYGVHDPASLIRKMIDDPGEYAQFATFIQTFNNLDKTLQEEVDEAKNS